jgi:hypothetical protein
MMYSSFTRNGLPFKVVTLTKADDQSVEDFMATIGGTNPLPTDSCQNILLDMTGFDPDSNSKDIAAIADTYFNAAPGMKVVAFRTDPQGDFVVWDSGSAEIPEGEHIAFSELSVSRTARVPERHERWMIYGGTDGFATININADTDGFEEWLAQLVPANSGARKFALTLGNCSPEERTGIVQHFWKLFEGVSLVIVRDCEEDQYRIARTSVRSKYPIGNMIDPAELKPVTQ